MFNFSFLWMNWRFYKKNHYYYKNKNENKIDTRNKKKNFKSLNFKKQMYNNQFPINKKERLLILKEFKVLKKTLLNSKTIIVYLEFTNLYKNVEIKLVDFIQ